MVILLLLSATPAFAQLRGTVTAGVGVSTIRPESTELKTQVKVRPSIGRVPARGFGIVMALNWFEADVSGRIVDTDRPLGTLAIRPLMLGVGYTWVSGRVGISPSLVAGAALNTLDVDDNSSFAVGGNAFEERVGTISRTVRPALGATLALAPRLGITGSVGYLVNRPTFTLRTPAGERRIPLDAGGLVLTAGAVVSLF